MCGPVRTDARDTRTGRRYVEDGGRESLALVEDYGVSVEALDGARRVRRNVEVPQEQTRPTPKHEHPIGGPVRRRHALRDEHGQVDVSEPDRRVHAEHYVDAWARPTEHLREDAKCPRLARPATASDGVHGRLSGHGRAEQIALPR